MVLRTGMGVFLLISVDIILPVVSMPRDRGVTSTSSREEVVLSRWPLRIAPYTRKTHIRAHRRAKERGKEREGGRERERQTDRDRETQRERERRDADAAA